MDAIDEILILLFLSSIVCGIFLEIELINKATIQEIELINKATIQEIETKETNMSDCYNLTFKETVTCLNEFVKSIFNYTVRNDTIKSLEDIKLNGGDCFDYSNLYKQLAIERGFNATTINIYNLGKSHTFALIYNSNSSYCVLDQKSIIGCFN